ncbi:MAG: DUF971 domain-containing protein [Gammaproteobacteria bacterium]|nr:DUF971 domain-containing protein [Gammaproteobacteria bacterium]NIM75044.1 DUF971 domain-containing protein [Gammaproteobacteria bacterium]NIN40094.1 DUF971 domain-containing protein [Gammaproteobacteria bacterium]NIO26581.1 DUF971 domain-containing protein [Gammaproteobacteria bacterium]NIO67133.1 DUF971 domain-containing protein [Gammaproteobacteria bacterium]
MNAKQIAPTEISYHKKSRVLDIAFGDEERFQLTAEFLRVHSPSAEVRGHGPGQEVLQIGKENVGIERIEPVGNYAVRLYFDDGHDTGLYSWEELYRFCVNSEQLWADYLSRLAAAGHKRRSGDS